MLSNKDDCIEALSKAHEDSESFHLIELLINDYFAMIKHMKETSLYDVYMYEERFAKNSLEPMRVLSHDNEKLRKEVNDLRKQLGLSKKYRD